MKNQNIFEKYLKGDNEALSSLQHLDNACKKRRTSKFHINNNKDLKTITNRMNISEKTIEQLQNKINNTQEILENFHISDLKNKLEKSDEEIHWMKKSIEELNKDV